MSIVGIFVGIALAILATACVRGLNRPTPEPAAVPGPRVTRAMGDVRVHALRTGWVSVKEAHRTLSGPDGLRIPAILLDQRWTEWMPVTVFAVEHPEGVWLVDAGLSEVSLDPVHFGCDPGMKFVYGNLLRFRFTPEERVDRQLAALGIDLARVRGVVFTHRHGDHTGAMDHLPSSVTAYVGAGDFPSHDGALPCRWPEDRAPVLVGEEGPSFGSFPRSTSLTRDGRLRIVPLRGHSPGHLGVMLESDGQYALFAGDSAFGIEQVRDGVIAGISEVPDLARQTLSLIGAQLREHRTFLLPAHDPASIDRFARGVPTKVSRSADGEE